MTKHCPKCDLDLPADEFNKSNKKRGGLQSYCRNCSSLTSNAWSAENSAHVKKRIRNQVIKKRFGLTPEEFNQLYLKQGGVCAICKRPEVKRDVKGNIRMLAVDHDHACCPTKKTCGKCIRGLLCDACNLAIGAMQDDPLRLQSAIEYVKKWSLAKCA
jgi:hypothetical protein